MPITYDIDRELGRLHLTVRGEFTAAEISCTMWSVIHSPELPDGFSALCDNTGVIRPLSPSQLILLVTLMERHAERFENACWAIVSTRPASYGMMRVLAARARLVLGMRVEIFFDVRRATEWLNGVPEPVET